MRLCDLLGECDCAPEPFTSRADTSVINELFKQPVPFQMHQIDGNMVVAGFKVGPLKYISYFARGEKAGKEFWDFTFEFAESEDGRDSASDNNTENTGLGGEFVVFATVVNIMREFIHKFKPNVLKFSGDSGNGRGRLYKIMVSKLGKEISQMGYTIDHSDLYGASYFTMMRKGVVKENGGRIVRGVNTTCDVGVDEIQRQAAKFGNRVDRDGRPAEEMQEGIFSRKENPKVSTDRIERAIRSDDEKLAAQDWEGKDARGIRVVARTADEPGQRWDSSPRPKVFGKRRR